MRKSQQTYERIAWVEYKSGIIESGIVRNNPVEKCDVIRLTIKTGKSKVDTIDEIFSLDEAISIVTVMQSAVCKYLVPHAETLRKLEPEPK